MLQLGLHTTVAGISLAGISNREYSVTIQLSELEGEGGARCCVCASRHTKCWHCGVECDLSKKTGAYILGALLEW